ncbi:MAG: NADH-quinone oxidoreductase subunit L, partial [Nitrospirae bacterium]
KALLFLCAGSVMHAMAGELDMQKMGGLKKYMPVTYWTMLIASLSISGIPGLAGFFSKDEILFRAYAAGGVGRFVWVLGTVAALLTAFYSFRLIFVTFHGEFRGTEEQRHHLHESPKVMTIPLILLCVGAVASGWVGIPPILGGAEHFAHFLEPVVGLPHAEEVTHAEEWMTMGLSVAVALAGIIVAAVFYLKNPSIPRSLAERFPFLYRLLWNKYYVDELYDLIVVRPALGVANNIIVKFTDGAIIEGIVNGVPAFIGWLGAQMRKVQDGVVEHYASIMAVGVFLLLAIGMIFLI